METAVLIPCYNEETTIAKVVGDFKKELPDAKVYVFDNNSTDKTAERAETAGAIVVREPRQGKGFVVRSMFSKVNADVYVLVDGDDTYPAENVHSMMLPIIEHRAEMVVGDRLSSTYFTENKRPLHNSGNRLVRWLINSLFRSKVKDVLSGYRVFSNDFVKNCPVMSEGFEIETEITIHALDRKYNIVEIPVNYRDRPEDSSSKLNTFSDGLRVLKMLTILFKDYKPMVFFSFLAIIFFILGVFMIYPVLTEYWLTGLVPRFPTLIVACFVILISLMLEIAGIVMNTIGKNNRKLYELIRVQNMKN